MNLTRDEWTLMWDAIRRIEIHNKNHMPPTKEDIQLIKDKIQQVIGQME